MKAALALALLLSSLSATAFADDAKPPAAADSLDRQQIKDGIDQAKDAVAACGKAHAAVKGVVKVAVTVGPKGDVTKLTVRETPDAALGTCVAAAVQKAKFAATRLGGSFSYPYPF